MALDQNDLDQLRNIMLANAASNPALAALAAAQSMPPAGNGGDTNPLGRPSWRAVFISWAVCAVLFFAVGVGANHWWEASDLKAKLAKTAAELSAEKAKPAKEVKVPFEVRTAGTNTISYVEKPVYIDKTTGKPVLDAKGQPVKDPADLLADQSKTTFTMAMIGPKGKRQDFTFKATPDEKYMFQNNRVEWVTAWDIRGELDARPMMEEYARAARDRVQLTGYLSNLGPAVGVDLSPRQHVHINAIATVPDPKKFFGLGIGGSF